MNAEQRAWRLREVLASVGATEDTVVVVSDWHFNGVGYRDDAERELAQAISERLRTQNTSPQRRKAA